MRVFLTGGTGLIGSHVAEHLRARGDEVVALHRARSDVTFLARLGCTLVPGDVGDGDALAGALRACDAAVHAAALVYARDAWERVHAVNVEGTANVVRAAARRAVPHLLHVSSVAVYGRAAPPIDEDTPTDGPLGSGDRYARSKREAESAAHREAGAVGIALTVLRPCAVYGERDRLLAARLGTLVRRPLTPVLGDGRNTVAAVYAGNVASAVVRCLDEPPRGGPRTYDLGMDHPVTQDELLLGLARGMERRCRLVHLPAGFVRAGARAGDALGLTVPGAGDLSLGRAVRLALADNPYGSARIRRELGWAPPVDRDEALARTGRWLREAARNWQT